MNQEEKINLRATVQMSVHEYTALKRDELKAKNPDMTPRELDALQPEIQEYDPVVQLALMGSDYSRDPALRRQANADAAQYLRPKLKSVEMLGDPRLVESQKERDALAHRLVDVMDIMAKAKSQSID